MQVERLRLTGFKSFVDAAELAIEPGLTGIVGPNGCGKSNLVEALRWVMGESSARRLRGGEMDDVIFAGTAGRPARNLAEVALKIDNSARDAPFAANTADEIEVIRRIERNGGSAYRINGREARARDVQLLFADAATGPHSETLVSQGRIGALVAARPVERRTLLDEAAGTAGLQARRHEAELRLKAAEDNLLRLDDVMAAMSGQLDTLKKQARQAQRYRRLAEQIRKTEAALFQARWQAAEAEAARVAAELRAAERGVAAATEQSAAALRRHAAAEAELPPLRLAEAEAAARLRRLTEARTALESELSRVIEARSEAERRSQQIAADLRREDEHLADSTRSLEALAAERAALERDDAAAEPARSAAAASLQQAADELTTAEAGLLQMTEACATGEARRVALERRLRETATQAARIQSRLAECERQRAALAALVVPPEETAAADAALAAAEEAAARCQADAERSAPALAACQAAETRALDAAHEAERRRARIAAEIEAIGALLDGTSPDGERRPGLLRLLQVPEGLEPAVAALFGDELDAPLAAPDGPRPVYGWIDLGPTAEENPLPAQAPSLAGMIDAPSVLRRRLAATGLVESDAEGWRLQAELAPGQSLIDRTGRLWRWDGFTGSRSGPTAAEQHLRQRNRLALLRSADAGAQAEAHAAEQQAMAARRAREDAAAADRLATASLRDAETAVARLRAAQAEVARRALDAEARLRVLAETADKLAAERAECEEAAAAGERELALLPDPALARSGLETARIQAAAARRRESEARAAIDSLTRDAQARRRRLAAIDVEVAAWRKRHGAAAEQHRNLAEREAALTREIAALSVRPAAIAAESETLASACTDAAADCRAAGDALALAETRLRDAGEAVRRAGQALAEAREGRARLEVMTEAAARATERLCNEVRERLGIAADSLADLADIAGDQTAPDPARTADRLDRLLRERDGMGPVNLVAEAEAVEVEARISGLRGERDDLTAAIARLRRAIGALDHEARKRLLAALEQLNEHFAALFVRLFGGGKAQLTLEEAADPLAAGLEIMASPPGKRLQSLSLLSGGEQALTALALLFAAFLTRPAPICVLDEVDAALDDANVERFCSLLAETADTAGTRFLVVTHHRVTMSRMDRLFGVTMAERGVSRLVSVDLARAVELRRTA